MTVGEKIKYALGLENYKYVYIRRVAGKEPAVYHVVYDSKLSNSIISNSKVKSLLATRFISFDDVSVGSLHMRKYRFFPITLLSEFKEKINKRDTFIVTDIAGEYLGDDPERDIVNKKLDFPETNIVKKVINHLRK